jgi:hypothetical protein
MGTLTLKSNTFVIKKGLIKVGLSILDKMVSARKHSQTVILSKAYTNMTFLTVRDSIDGKMAALLMAIFSKACDKVMVN